MVGVALKEWAIVCDLLAAGRVCLLLRKGGVQEFDGPGRFRLEHERFGMFPAWEHERLEWIKPCLRVGMRSTPIEAEPDNVVIACVAEVAGVWEVPSREAFDELDDLHAWTPEQVDMRFSYKPARPLYALAVRVSRLGEPHVIPNRAPFAGCRSWVPLDEDGDPVEGKHAVQAIPAEQLAEQVKRIEATLRA